MRYDNIDYKELGKNIRDERIAKKFTQEYIADKIEISTKHISGIENGRTKPSIKILLGIANILNVSIDKLLLGSVENSKITYDKEVKNLLEDLNNKELKLIVETIKFQKEMIKKAAETKTDGRKKF